MANDSWLALDVGGANIKAAHAAGVILSRAFALWRNPESIPSELVTLAGSMPPFDRVALTMTAELCDCYPTKRESMVAVLDTLAFAAGLRTAAPRGLHWQMHSPDRSTTH